MELHAEERCFVQDWGHRSPYELTKWFINNFLVAFNRRSHLRRHPSSCVVSCYGRETIKTESKLVTRMVLWDRQIPSAKLCLITGIMLVKKYIYEHISANHSLTSNFVVYTIRVHIIFFIQSRLRIGWCIYSCDTKIGSIIDMYTLLSRILEMILRESTTFPRIANSNQLQPLETENVWFRSRYTSTLLPAYTNVLYLD